MNLIVRKDQSKMTDAEKVSFRDAIEKLIKNGEYGKLVGHHAKGSKLVGHHTKGKDMTHRMHGRMSGTIGYQRFLPWHRVYLIHFGEALRTINSNLFIPYWRWSIYSKVPDWIADFMPQNIFIPQEGEKVSVERELGPAKELASLEDDVEEVLTKNEKWTNFTKALEDGPHNKVHRWVGKTMGTMHSPADPLFWMHHAEIDRIWEIWQKSHPNPKFDLSEDEAILDPWNTYKAEAVLDTQSLGYRYDSLSL